MDDWSDDRYLFGASFADSFFVVSEDLDKEVDSSYKGEDVEQAAEQNGVFSRDAEGPEVVEGVNARPRTRYRRVEDMRSLTRKKRRPRGVNQDSEHGTLGSSRGRIIRRPGMEIVPVENAQEQGNEGQQSPEVIICKVPGNGEGISDERLASRSRMETVRVEDEMPLNGEEQQTPDIVEVPDLPSGGPISGGELVRNSQGEIEGRVIVNEDGEIGLEI
ncbi:hypothetical protein BZA77DRAFT_389329 [Pyronema omphalodes]|nr:hypothetical protein BZA77DRAFT_389329 [Pyronema omphalodes]